MSECEHGQLDVVLMCKRCESRRATFRSDTVAVLPVSEAEHYKEAARLLRGWMDDSVGMRNVGPNQAERYLWWSRGREVVEEKHAEA